MGETIAATPEFDALRAECRDEIERRGLSAAAAARQIGPSGGTLSQWLAGKYPGDNAGVAAKVQTWIDSVRARDRARASMPLVHGYVATPSAVAFLSTLEHAQYVVDVVVISGGAGVGKTTAAERYRCTHPNVWLLTAQPAVANTFAVLESLAAVLNVAERSAARRPAAIVDRLRNSAGLVIVDEAQHLAPPALDQLRQTVHDLGGIGLALVGNQDVYTRIDGGAKTAKFAQLHSRVGMQATRQRPQAADVDAILDAYSVTGAEERRLLRTVAGKPGALRGMIKVLRLARMISDDEGEAAGITASDINAAWKKLLRSDDAQEAA